MQKGCTNGEYFCIINLKDINMKKIILSVLFAASSIIASAQSKTDVQQNTQLDTTAVYLLQRISQHTAPCYKLYKTENMWTFLELETFSGRIWQVQYSVDDTKASRMKTILSSRNLVSEEDGEYAGRFELYPTQNMYNFILLDTETGRTWQAQWSTSYSNRGIVEIE